MKEQGHPFRVLQQLVHHRAVAEAADVLGQAMHPSWCHLHNFARV
eukprot:CAMPEP_0172881188 /NCGR_PEP_ID=MMETSP1075-20121228/116853_1 /TAXON_ID=2916 /ORGANISM="Ceratium fusus, Strain PA161109" /LENGTH=44 /DNA_ID= /DNA_START= /DNA_END= /DNA_ORIENTATION=